MSKLSKIHTIKSHVRDILGVTPTEKINYRDNDEALVARYWHGQLTRLGYNPSTMKANELLSLYASGKLTAADDITRARRMLQEDEPQYRGSKWNDRHKEADQFRKGVKGGSDEE